MQFKQIEVATSDDRGNISDILYKTNFQHAAIIQTFADNEKPVIRGNHYHKQTTQHIYILDGALTYWYETLTNVSDEGYTIAAFGKIYIAKGCLVTSSPYEIHALEIRENCRFIVFSDGVRGGQDYESDTYRVEPILTPEMLTPNLLW